MKIDKFDGDYAFLSNFYGAPVKYNGILFPNSEAAFQAQKCPTRAIEFANTKTPGQAKRLGRQVPLRTDWNLVRIGIMEDIVRCKFVQHPILANKLVATGDAELIEGNYWHDCFWGVCNGFGENHLGQILMKIRTEFINERTEANEKYIRY